MERRRFLLTSLAGVVALPFAAAAQPAAQVPRVGVLMNLYPPDAPPPQAFRQELRGLGYIEGQNLVVDWRYQLGRSDRLAALAAELVSLKPNVLVADVTVAIRAAMGATRTIPIVMASSADAVGSGLVTQLGRPGGNVTGVTIGT
jgi:putative ABC transport system substrate-binding protein